jgi:hypothetical protein
MSEHISHALKFVDQFLHRIGMREWLEACGFQTTLPATEV